MSDIRFNRWLHQSGTGGVYQASSGNVGIGTSVPSTTLDVNGSISATSITATTGTITGNLSVGGVLTYDDVTNIDSVGVITARSDVSIADKIIHTGDTNTAIRFPAADTFTVETGGSERLRITSDGNLVMNGGSPNHDASSGSIFLIPPSGNPNRGIKWSDTSDTHYVKLEPSVIDGLTINGYSGVAFATGSRTNSTWAERLRIDSSGRVLIADAATAGPMETFGSAVLQVATTAGGTLVLGRNDSSVSTDNGIGSIYFDVNDSSGNAWNETARITVNADGDHANNDYPSRMEFYTTGDGQATPTERLRIISDGTVLINPAGGTALGRLTVAGDGKDITFGRTQNSGTGGVGRLVATGNIVYLQAGANASSGSAADLVFGAYGGVGEKMRIMSDGTVKIGTGTGNPILMLSASTSGTSVIQMGDTADNNIGQIHYVNSDDSMRFFANNSERLRISSAGDITLGYAGSSLYFQNGFNNSAARIQNGGGSNNSELKFLVRNAGTESEKMRLTSTAGLAIATAGSVLANAGNETLYIQGEGHNGHGTSNTRSVVSIIGAHTSNNAGMGIWIGTRTNENTAVIGTRTASGDLAVETYNGGWGERLRINSAGELLIGETNSPTDEGISGATRCKIGMSFGNSTGNYIEMGGTSRAANGLSKLAVMRHGYWGGEREVGSLGFLTSSSSGGAGRGMGNFVVHTGTSGNGDAANSGDNISIERLRVGSEGIFYVNTTSSNNWSQTSGSSNSDHNNSGNQRSGNMCFRTSEGALVIANDADSGYSAIYINKYEWNSGDDNRWINFYLNGAGKDSISWNGSNIVYGNNSDYRIKTNIRSYTGGIDLVKQIQVRQYDYIETERGTDHVGFIAHELQEVIPDAVSGEKDAMRTEEETGEEVMDIQNVDYGRVTPILTAALKEAIAKIETLEARITALEG